MRLFVFLGNPGAEYYHTRHNLGFLVGEELRQLWWYPDWRAHKSSNSLISQQGEIILAQPQSYMNRSGQVVQTLQSRYKIDLQDILVMHDDIDLAPGVIKLKHWGSAWGHNGLKDIIRALWTQDFRRIRLGVGRPAHPKADISHYVLSTLPPELLDQTPEIAFSVEELLITHKFLDVTHT